MDQTKPSPLFGISIDPAAGDPQEPFERARLADELGADLITLMDHPYNAKLFDTWTLATALATRTRRVQIGTNVLNLPLRPPVMLAKMAATLDVLSAGRLELGLGAGAFWEGIAAFGGPQRTPGEAFRAFEEALHILRGMWENAGGSFSYSGKVYQVKGARPGPAPAHPIRLWVGAGGPRMLGLTGRLADGLFVSFNYVPPGQLAGINRLVDEGALAAGREPGAIRRGYNLMGVLNTGSEGTRLPGLKDDYIQGTARVWIDQIVEWHVKDRMDTFIFWPVAGNQRLQIETFAREVIPAVKARLASEG